VEDNCCNPMLVVRLCTDVHLDCKGCNALARLQQPAVDYPDIECLSPQHNGQDNSCLDRTCFEAGLINVELVK
jgi:hypothetical protein